jgi:hypothetical protein
VKESLDVVTVLTELSENDFSSVSRQFGLHVQSDSEWVIEGYKFVIVPK